MYKTTWRFAFYDIYTVRNFHSLYVILIWGPNSVSPGCVMDIRYNNNNSRYEEGLTIVRMRKNSRNEEGLIISV